MGNTLFLGARPYDFVDDKTGKQVTGVSIHIAENGMDNATGYVSSKISMSNDGFAQVFGGLAGAAGMVLKPIHITYNRFGKPESVQLVEHGK